MSTPDRRYHLTGPGHYRRAEERLQEFEETGNHLFYRSALIHAQLAQAAATAGVWYSERHEEDQEGWNDIVQPVSTKQERETEETT